MIYYNRATSCAPLVQLPRKQKRTACLKMLLRCDILTSPRRAADLNRGLGAENAPGGDVLIKMEALFGFAISTPAPCHRGTQSFCGSPGADIKQFCFIPIGTEYFSFSVAGGVPRSLLDGNQQNVTSRPCVTVMHLM